MWPIIQECILKMKAALSLICLIGSAVVALGVAPANAEIVRCNDRVFRDARDCPGARQTPPAIKTESPRHLAPASREDTEDLARVESLRDQCNAAGAAAKGSTSAMGKFAAAQLGIGYCSKYERAAKDRQRYEALRSQDPVAAAKELEAQRLAREERRRGAAINAQGKKTMAGTPQDTTNSNGCSSDFGCGIGYRCVKHAFEISGTCMQEVDSMGLPTYGTPRSSSLDVKTKNQCMFSTDCPIGFACDPTYGACVKQ